jgi:hypothetical protein
MTQCLFWNVSIINTLTSILLGILLKEVSSVPITPDSTHGLIYVQYITPNQLHYVNDSRTNFNLSSIGTGCTGGITEANSTNGNPITRTYSDTSKVYTPCGSNIDSGCSKGNGHYAGGGQHFLHL